jgi:myo-inositol-hexaphosphate 3-phosphohydrolase
MACITSQANLQVECWRIPAGTLAARAVGFTQRANGCDIDDTDEEMVATDVEANALRIYTMNDLRDAGGSNVFPTRSIVDGTNFDLPLGVCIGWETAQSDPYTFVTNDGNNTIAVHNMTTGAFIRSWTVSWATSIEGIECDDDLQLVYVCDDAGALGCQAYTYAGVLSGNNFGDDECAGRGFPESPACMSTDAEGVALYECDSTNGFLFVSDQNNDEFEIFNRETVAGTHTWRCMFEVFDGGDKTNDCDGIDIFQDTSYPNGLFGACDNCGGVAVDELDLVYPVTTEILQACAVVCP